MGYKEDQRKLQEAYFTRKGIAMNGRYIKRPWPFCVLDRRDNMLSHDLADNVEQYFATEDIEFWGRETGGPNLLTTHTLSSQVACLNHLFPIRHDPVMVSRVATALTGERFAEILPVPIDSEPNRGYIAFEIVSRPNLINERITTRGTMCTSIDAMIIARRDNGQRVIIPIEWKYTELYDDFSKYEKSTEANPQRPMPNEARGQSRLRNYSSLIEQSELMRSDITGDNSDLPAGCTPSPYRRSIYFLEPFYELMRQTLLIEQFMRHGAGQWIGPIDDYIHVLVCPSANHEYLDMQYQFTDEQGLEAAWRACLTDRGNARFRIVDPASLAPIFPNAEYLQERYYSEE